MGDLKKRASFARVVNYVNNPKKARLIDSKDVRLDDNATIARSMQGQADDKPGRKLKNPVYHISLDFAHEDTPKLTDALMVEIAREVSQRLTNALFVLAGEGPGLHHLRQLVQQYGLEQGFQLPGFVQDMDTFYRSLHLYLNTSFHEGIPMSILEAMAYGLPVIAPKIGGLTEIITNGVDGYLVEGRNPRDFAERCASLIADRLRRISMGEKAKEKVEHGFAHQSMARSYYQLYLGLPLQ